MLYKVPQDKIQFERIAKMPDSEAKFYKLSHYMFKVEPYSYFWIKAKEESDRLSDLGFGF